MVYRLLIYIPCTLNVLVIALGIIQFLKPEDNNAQHEWYHQIATWMYGHQGWVIWLLVILVLLHLIVYLWQKFFIKDTKCPAIDFALDKIAEDIFASTATRTKVVLYKTSGNKLIPWCAREEFETIKIGNGIAGMFWKEIIEFRFDRLYKLEKSEDDQYKYWFQIKNNSSFWGFVCMISEKPRPISTKLLNDISKIISRELVPLISKKEISYKKFACH